MTRRFETRHRAHLILAVALSAIMTSCRGGPRTAHPLQDFGAWQTLDPLAEAVRSHGGKPSQELLTRARQQLSQKQIKAASATLATPISGMDAQWLHIARADLAALYATVCIRGIALRIEDPKNKQFSLRRVDMSPETKIEPSDISLETLLNQLEVAVGSEVLAMQVHGRIARARIAALVSTCAPNETVSTRAAQTLEADLATLAAEQNLTPDLAYVWGTFQLERYSGVAARPFLLQAEKGGFREPSLTLMLAGIAVEQGELDNGQTLAQNAEQAYKNAGQKEQAAQATFLFGKIAEARKQNQAARQYYEDVLKVLPAHHGALFSLTRLIQQSEGEEAAAERMQQALSILTQGGEQSPEQAKAAAERLESLVIRIEEPYFAELMRSGLLLGIDSKPSVVQGLHYFFAAVLDARLGDYEAAQGHAILAREDFTESEIPPPVDIPAFLQNLSSPD